MEDLEILRKRLVYQSHHRGMRELDFLLGRFADKYVPSMSYVKLKEFEVLLDFPDQELYGWFFEKTAIPQNSLQSLILTIQEEISLPL